MTISRGGVAPLYGIGLTASRAFSIAESKLEAHLNLGFGPNGLRTIDRAEGRTRLGYIRIGAGVHWRRVSGFLGRSLYPGLTASWFQLSATGAPNKPEAFVGRTRRLNTVLLGGTLTFQKPMTTDGTWRLWARTDLGHTVRRIRLFIGDTVTSRFGGPYARFNVGFGRTF